MESFRIIKKAVIVCIALVGVFSGLNFSFDSGTQDIQLFQSANAQTCPQQGGLIPCGRTCDDPGTTQIDESARCTLCHLVVGIKGLIDYGFRILIFIATAMIVAAGIMYIVSAGNENMTNMAKEAIKSVLYGFSIVLLAWVFINTIILYIGARDDLGVIDQGENWWQITCDAPGATSPVATPGTGTGGEDNTTDGPEENVGGLVVSPTMLNFGEVTPGIGDDSITPNAASREVILKNTNTSCNVPLQEEPFITGGDNFFIQSNTCPAELADGESCVIKVAFSPDDCQEYEETLNIFRGENPNLLCLDSSDTVPVTLRGQGQCYEDSVSIEPSALTVSEDGTVAEVQVSREDGTNPLTIHVETEISTSGNEDERAVAGQDFTAVEGDISWEAGDTSPIGFAVPIQQDNETEKTEKFFIRVSLVEGEAYVPLAATVSILDDDQGYGTVEFEQLSHIVNENLGATGQGMQIGITRSGAISGDVTVRVKGRIGTATENQDFVVVPNELTWVDGQNGTKYIDVRILDDTEIESNEAFALFLEKVSGPDGVVNTQQEASVIIQDND